MQTNFYGELFLFIKLEVDVKLLEYVLVHHIHCMDLKKVVCDRDKDDDIADENFQ